MYIKVQSGSVEFDEYAAQHPETELIETSHGADGGLLFQILFPFALEVVKDIVGYIAKKLIEKKRDKKGEVIFVFEGGKIVRIPEAKFDNLEEVLRMLQQNGK